MLIGYYWNTHDAPGISFGAGSTDGSIEEWLIPDGWFVDTAIGDNIGEAGRLSRNCCSYSWRNRLSRSSAEVSSLTIPLSRASSSEKLQLLLNGYRKLRQSFFKQWHEEFEYGKLTSYLVPLELFYIQLQTTAEKIFFKTNHIQRILQFAPFVFFRWLREFTVPLPPPPPPMSSPPLRLLFS